MMEDDRTKDGGAGTWSAETSRNPDDFPEEDGTAARSEAMTDAQRAQLQVLTMDAGEEFPGNLTRSEADRKIDELLRKAGQKP
ncbi:MAG TPA: DUF3072 domain-containing protein [Azospirillaceae bacterium]|nr:DUF3072 domain-containing protein [Azospirillaceae bacterium]